MVPTESPTMKAKLSVLTLSAFLARQICRWQDANFAANAGVDPNRLWYGRYVTVR